MRHLVGVIAAGLIAGCTCQPERIPIPKPVLIPGPVQYVPLPAEATADCGLVPKLRDGMAGGELLEAAKALEQHSACRDGQIESIKALQRAM